MREDSGAHWPVGAQFAAFMQRTEPGRGATLPPEPPEQRAALPKMKSIPNVSTERLKGNLATIHESVHTVEGLRQLDMPRRGLIEQGMRGRMIAHELTLRGEHKGDCRYCYGS